MKFFQYINPWRCADEDSPVNLRSQSVGTWRAWFLAWLPGHILDYLKSLSIEQAVKSREPLGTFMVIPPGYAHRIIHRVPSPTSDPLDARETVAIKLTWRGEDRTTIQ